MNEGLIPQRYAKALYKYAMEHGNATEVYEEAKQVIGAFVANPDLRKVLANPFIANSQKETLLIAAAGDKVEDDYRSFVKLILNHKREEFAWQMMLAYREIYRKANKIAQVNITTATNLDEKALDKMRQVVKQAFPDTTLEFNYTVDPEIIGGFVIDVDSTRMDASISNELEQLRLNLLSK